MHSELKIALRSQNKIAFLFPGVGSEYTSMGKYIYDNFQCARQIFEQASTYANRDIAKLCFLHEYSDALGELANAKLGTVTVGLASSEVLVKEFGIIPDYCAGHSAGEYAALCCAGILTLRDTVSLLEERAKTINSVLCEVQGRMAWVVNLDSSTVEGIVASLQNEGHQVYISGYDCSGQTSISATVDSIRPCAAAMEAAGAIVIPINTTGPFHSPFMEQASAQFQRILKQYEFGNPRYTVLANHNALPYTEDNRQTIENLTLHLIRPVQWYHTIQFLLENRVRYAIELGPKEILRFLLDKTTHEISCLSLDTRKQWETFQSERLMDRSDVVRTISKCLGVIASTRNKGQDLNHYQTDVVDPNNTLKRLLETLKSEKIQATKSHLDYAVEVTGSILKAKQVPDPEVVACLTKLLGRHVVDFVNTDMEISVRGK